MATTDSTSTANRRTREEVLANLAATTGADGVAVRTAVNKHTRMMRLLEQGVPGKSADFPAEDFQPHDLVAARHRAPAPARAA